MLATTGKSIFIMQRSRAAAVLVDPEYLGRLEAALEDMKAIKEREYEPAIPEAP